MLSEILPLGKTRFFFLCVCECVLSADNQYADVLQKFARYLWVDRRFGPFASYCYSLRRVCWHYDYSSPIVWNWLRDGLVLHDFTSGCHIPASLSWNVSSYSLLSFYLDLSLSILPCSLFCYYAIMSSYVTIGTVNQMYSTVFWKRPLDGFARGRLWTLMVGHRCNGDMNEQ